jgi:hypothetical protein
MAPGMFDFVIIVIGVLLALLLVCIALMLLLLPMATIVKLCDWFDRLRRPYTPPPQPRSLRDEGDLQEPHRDGRRKCFPISSRLR